MELITVYWDEIEQRQKERPCTTEEIADIEARRNAPAPVPQTVSRRQACQALLLRGLLSSVPAKIAAIPDDTQRALAQIYWDDSQEFIRSHALIVSLGAALGLDAAALDDLFRFAGTL